MMLLQKRDPQGDRGRTPGLLSILRPRFSVCASQSCCREGKGRSWAPWGLQTCVLCPAICNPAAASLSGSCRKISWRSSGAAPMTASSTYSARVLARSPKISSRVSQLGGEGAGKECSTEWVPLGEPIPGSEHVSRVVWSGDAQRACQ